MKKLIIILLAVVAFSCNNGISEKDVIGKYKVTMNMEVDPNDEAGSMALGMFAMAEIKYEFLKNGKLNSSVKMGALGQEDNEGKWSLKNDTIYLDDESYFIEKSEEGFLLKADEVELTLSEID